MRNDREAQVAKLSDLLEDVLIEFRKLDKSKPSKPTPQVIEEYNAVCARLDAQKKDNKPFIVRHAKSLKHVSLTYGAVCLATGFFPAAAVQGMLAGMAHLLDKKFNQ